LSSVQSYTMQQVILQKLKAGQVDDLKGTNIHFQLPLKKDFINWNLSQLQLPKMKSVQFIYINPRETAVHLHTSIPFYSNKTIRGEVYKAIDVPRFTLKINVTDGLNRLERGLMQRFLPQGVRLKGTLMEMDLFDFVLKNSDYAFAAQYIHNVHLQSNNNAYLLDFDLII